MTQDAPRADDLAATRTLAATLNNRAWDLIEQSMRSASEQGEMCDAAVASRHLWYIATGGAQGAPCIERLRGHHLVACAMAKAGRMSEASRAAQRATETEAALPQDAVMQFDRVMTMVTMHLASGARELDPNLNAAVGALDKDERAVANAVLVGS